MDKLSQLLAEQYPEPQEEYNIHKVIEEMDRLHKEVAVDNMLDNTQ